MYSYILFMPSRVYGIISNDLNVIYKWSNAYNIISYKDWDKKKKSER